MAVILISGDCGFLGWNIARGLTQSGDMVVCFDVKKPDSRLNNGKIMGLKLLKEM